MPGRILVIDDEPQITRVLRAALSAQGFDVRTANDPEEALRVFREWPPDLVIMGSHCVALDVVLVAAMCVYAAATGASLRGVVPFALTRRPGTNVGTHLLTVRRIAIFTVLLLAYLYYRLAGEAQLAAIGLMAFATLVATPFVVRRAMAGLGQAAAQAERIDIDRRGVQLSVEEVPTEIIPLVKAVNDALRRHVDPARLSMVAAGRKT